MMMVDEPMTPYTLKSKENQNDNERYTSENEENNRYGELHGQLASSLLEMKDQRELLRMAAENGKLLAEKYFQLEHQRDEMDHEMENLNRVVLQYKNTISVLQTEKQTLVMKCIGAEQQLNSITREKHVQDTRQKKQEVELLRAREAIGALRSETKTLRDSIQQLQMEQLNFNTVRQQDMLIHQELQAEKAQLKSRVEQLESRLMQWHRDERTWKWVHEVQLQKMNTLEHTVASLDSVIKRMHEDVEAMNNDPFSKEENECPSVLMEPISRIEESCDLKPPTSHFGVALMWLLASSSHATISYLRFYLHQWAAKYQSLQRCHEALRRITRLPSCDP